MLGLVSRLGQATAYYDANGHYARAYPIANIFSNTAGALAPQSPAQQYNFYNDPDQLGRDLRPLPGRRHAADRRLEPVHRRPAVGGQDPNPKCDRADVPPGP